MGIPSYIPIPALPVQCSTTFLVASITSCIRPEGSRPGPGPGVVLARRAPVGGSDRGY